MDTEPDGWRTQLQRVAAAPGRCTAWLENSAYDITYAGHQHPNPTIVLCLSGVARMERAGQRLDLHPGDSVAIAAGVQHLHAELRPGAVVLCQGFLSHWSDVVVDWSEGRWCGRLPLAPYANLVDRVLSAPTHQQATAAAAAWVERVAARPPLANDYRQPVLRPMVELMWRRSLAGLTAEALVRASGASRTVAYAVFTRWYGLPPRAAILRNRLVMAESLLKQGVPVARVAQRCGFTNPDTFTRCWRKAHGSPPRSWRARLRGPGQGSDQDQPKPVRRRLDR